MKKYFLFLFIFPLFNSCAPRTGLVKERVYYEKVYTERTVDYRDISVPEEGGMQFTLFTDEIESIKGPNVTKNKGVIRWFTSSLIAVSPDGLKVAYIAEKDKKTNVYLKSLEGGKKTIQRTFRDNVVGVAFSPDGTNISFVDKIDDDHNIYQINATQGAAIQQITNSTSLESSPEYSSANDLIFYTKAEYSSNLGEYRYYIWSYNLSTAISTQYSEGFAPCVSSDDKTLYVTRNDKESGLGEIWSINLETGQEIRILDDSEMGFSTPKISPDGSKLLCTGSTLATKERIENLDLYVVNTDGTGLTQLTFHQGNDVSGVWGPKGDKIYFMSQRGNESGNFGVWMIDYNKE